MNTELLSLAVVQFLLSLFLAIVLLYGSFRLIHRFIVVKHELSYDNVAFAILAACILFSVAYLVAGIRDPILHTIRFLQNDAVAKQSLIVESSKYIGLFIGISIVGAGLVNAVAIWLYMLLTRGIDEFAEIKRGNAAVAILSGVIIIGVSLMVRDSMMLILEAFIPYPEVTELF